MIRPSASHPRRQVHSDDRATTARSPVLEFTDKATRDGFSARAIEALLAGPPCIQGAADVTVAHRKYHIREARRPADQAHLADPDGTMTRL